MAASRRDFTVGAEFAGRRSVADLTLWHRIDVADRPSVDLALQWLGTLVSGGALSPEDGRRVRTPLVQYRMGSG